MNGFETILPFLKPIEHLILDDSISEVMVNGADCVFIERQGLLEHVSGVSLGERALMVAVKNIARRLGGDISESQPILDSRLPDGSRVAAVIPPCSLRGVTLTIRKFRKHHFAIDDLIALGALDQPLANRLEDYVLARRNILISGAKSTGKTTILGALGKFIPGDERILLIEDTAEIRMPHTNLVRFEAPPPQTGPDPARRNSRRRSVRPSSAPQYRPLRNAFNHSCEFRTAGPGPFHQLCPAERNRAALPLDSEKHRGFAQRSRARRTPTGPQVPFRSFGNQRVRPGRRSVRLHLGVLQAGDAVRNSQDPVKTTLGGREFLEAAFEPSDRIAILVRSRVRSETLQRITTAERIAEPSFQHWLRFKNDQESADVYVGMN